MCLGAITRGYVVVQGIWAINRKRISIYSYSCKMASHTNIQSIKRKFNSMTSMQSDVRRFHSNISVDI